MENLPEQKQISFFGELLRKTTHMFSLVIPVSYYLLDASKYEMLRFLIPATILMILIDVSRLMNLTFWEKFGANCFKVMIRKHESEGDFTGATYILTSFCLTISLFEKHIAIAALSFIIVGDTFAALIGRRFGRHKFWNKSWEGSFACLAGTVIVALLVPSLTLTVALFGAVVAAVTEALPFGIDDNLTVPLVSGTAMMILSHFSI